MSGEKTMYSPKLADFKKSIPIEGADINRLTGKPFALEYYEVLNNPKLPWVLVTYEVHPNENMAEKAVIEVMDQFISKPEMPNILFVPKGSPTGIERLQELSQNLKESEKNRNKWEHDLNWEFNENTTDPEARVLMKLSEGRKFKRTLHIHHDWGMKGKYFYGYLHSLITNFPHFNWNKLRTALSALGFQPFSGHKDDEDNDALRNEIPETGLIYTHPEDIPEGKFEGNFENWLVKTGKTKFACTLELTYDLSETDSVPLLNAIYSSFFEE